MKKAVYYARVSTALQEEKGTIESQKYELINQIKNDGNILVKEYIDNGWSGARLDRPALDELRKDLKTDTFEVIYFLDSDRIARDSTYQNIIIAEILKYNKEIYIKGKNYVNNPENKFTITVLGAVNELEKAKIVERMMRGRREKARRGAIVDSGGLFGYNHVKKTDTKDGHYLINEDQAYIVRFIFETYANTEISLTGLIRILEKKGFKTATGKSYWKSSVIRAILTNTSYYGKHYFNKTYKVEPLTKKNGKAYARAVKTTARLRDREEWIEVDIPPVISKELFDRVQEKLIRNGKLKRNNGDKYLLSGLVKCGKCEHTYSGTNWKGISFYKCNFRDKRYAHIEEVDLKKCNNQAIKAGYLEEVIENIIKTKVLKPSIIAKHIDTLKKSKGETLSHFNKEIEKIKIVIDNKNTQKKRILDLYADGSLEKEEYLTKIEEIDKGLDLLAKQKEELENKINSISNRNEIKKSVNDFCKLAKRRYLKLDPKNKKAFIAKIIDEVIIFKDFENKKLIIRGLIPVNENKDNNAFIGGLPNYCTRHWSGFGWRRRLA